NLPLDSRLLKPLIRICEQICNIRMTVVANNHALWLYFSTLYPGQQPRPSENLRHRERQDQGVGDIMITTCSAFSLSLAPLQSIHAHSIQTVSCPTAFHRVWLNVNRCGYAHLVLSLLA